MPRDDGNLFLSSADARNLREDQAGARFVRKFVGSEELINGKLRYFIWIEDEEVEVARRNDFLDGRLKAVEINRGRAKKDAIVVPRVSSENRDYLPVDYLTS